MLFQISAEVRAKTSLAKTTFVTIFLSIPLGVIMRIASLDCNELPMQPYGAPRPAAIAHPGENGARGEDRSPPAVECAAIMAAAPTGLYAPPHLLTKQG
jgi:hypothetical protein